eukprot:366144-Chlamydomonas_euryale.AAC.4
MVAFARKHRGREGGAANSSRRLETDRGGADSGGDTLSLDSSCVRRRRRFTPHTKKEAVGRRRQPSAGVGSCTAQAKGLAWPGQPDQAAAGTAAANGLRQPRELQRESCAALRSLAQSRGSRLL